MNQNYITPASENTSADYTIPAFAEPITALPDTPACSASELKRRFQAPSEELRQAHNALATAHEALDAKVEGIVAETFVGAIHETMLDEPLASKLNGKADQAALDTEQTTRQSADTALQTQISAKCEVVFGTYTGDDTISRIIELGFTPKAVLAQANKLRGEQCYWGLALPGEPCSGSDVCLEIVSNGFRVREYSYTERMNTNGQKYNYVAFK